VRHFKFDKIERGLTFDAKPHFIAKGYAKLTDKPGFYLRSLDNNTKVINTLGLFNIDEIKSLISKLDIFISVDTGPVYIAEAFNIPTIDIIGPVDEHEQPPIGEIHKIVKAKRKKPAMHIMNARHCDEREVRKQVDEITVDMVIKVFNDLYTLLKK